MLRIVNKSIDRRKKSLKQVQSDLKGIATKLDQHLDREVSKADSTELKIMSKKHKTKTSIWSRLLNWL